MTRQLSPKQPTEPEPSGLDIATVTHIAAALMRTTDALHIDVRLLEDRHTAARRDCTAIVRRLKHLADLTATLLDHIAAAVNKSPEAQ